jgi:hypothetical protein
MILIKKKLVINSLFYYFSFESKTIIIIIIIIIIIKCTSINIIACPKLLNMSLQKGGLKIVGLLTKKKSF